MALAALGSIVGCTRAGQAACGAMLETESGHGRFVGVASMPASQTIYGIVVMLALNRPVTAQNAAALFAIGVLSGMVLGLGAYYQGLACASAIDAAKNKTETEALRAEARTAAEAERQAVVHAFELAKRDALLALKDELCVQLAGRLRRMVAREIADPDLLRQTVLAAVGDGALPGEADRLLGEAARSLFGGGAGSDVGSGIRFRLAEGDIVVEVTDETLGQLLAEHLMPRFRARLDGTHAD